MNKITDFMNKLFRKSMKNGQEQTELEELLAGRHERTQATEEELAKTDFSKVNYRELAAFSKDGETFYGGVGEGQLVMERIYRIQEARKSMEILSEKKQSNPFIR